MQFLTIYNFGISNFICKEYVILGQSPPILNLMKSFFFQEKNIHNLICIIWNPKLCLRTSVTYRL